MSTLKAKPIVEDQYWVVTDGDKKVGNVMAYNSGYTVKINGNVHFFDSATDLKEKTKIEFENIKIEKSKKQILFSNYPTTPRIYNSVLDVKRKLHIYTKSPKSKCYYASGYYVMNLGIGYEVIFCPKYIFIQRYPYYGPFETHEQAQNMINTL